MSKTANKIIFSNEIPTTPGTYIVYGKTGKDLTLMVVFLGIQNKLYFCSLDTIYSRTNCEPVERSWIKCWFSARIPESLF